MNEQAYQTDFEFFLDHTNEKRVLERAIRTSLPPSPVSMLDIGAGNGLLSLPLAKSVQKYLAIEPHQKFVQALRHHGLEVVEKSFPCPLKEQFNFILISHSLPYENFQTFLQAAWDALAEQGKLLIVTYRGEADDWTWLMGQLERSQGKNVEDYNRIGFNRIVEFLYSLSSVKIRKVVTTVEAENVTDMITALSFVAGDGDPQKRQEFYNKHLQVEKILQQKYKRGEGYSFPFTHYFLEIAKVPKT